jgi:hypothetical protein
MSNPLNPPCGNIPEGHFVVVFHFKPDSTHSSRGDDIHYLADQALGLIKDTVAVADGDIGIPGDPLHFLFSSGSPSP